MSIATLLLLIAFILFVVAIFRPTTVMDLVAAGLAFATASVLVPLFT